MRATVIALALLLPAAAFAAEPAEHMHEPGMDHAAHMAMMADGAAPAAMPSEPGQSAFAAVAEIVALLEADPKTDWSAVNIDALRAHLADMDNVTLHAVATARDIEGGARFEVTGTEAVAESIRRMVPAHAATMDGSDGWHFSAEEIAGGAAMTVTGASPEDAVKIRALGFFGVITRGMHHQAHHLMIASGGNPHH
ncbi:MAG: hypothetical protein R3D02_07040 [Hyphomicrobiales bacterium]